MTFKFQAFHALSNPELATAFHEGHTRILTDLGIESITSNYPEWMRDPNVIAIIVTAEDDSVVGGIRVHKYDGSFELPIVSAIKDQDEKIIEIVNKRKNTGGISESCGLWNAKKVFGQGISPLLARSSVSLSNQFNTKSLVCFSAPYTLRMIKQLGFNEITEIGEAGKFPYPNEKFISSVLEIPDIHQISSATIENHRRIVSLMEQPNQSCVESSQGKELTVEYNLFVEFS
ncbi:MAG: hypothetical protein IPP69_02820 [Flavobacteriales bacterium]|nr:hypothetical protein [Flavobacteriales bacterium]